MSTEQRAARPGILGCGHALPPHVRCNDDPLYAHLDTTPNRRGVSEPDLFVGLRERRYLAPGESIEPLMVDACRQALARAGVEPEQVDRLYGYASVPDYTTPNPLYAVHRTLSLPVRTMVVPVNSEFSNFPLGLVLAGEAISSGRVGHALVVCGSNWTGHLDYTKGHAFTAGDAAGAAVVGPAGGLELIDHETRTYSEYYDAMRMGIRPVLLNGRNHLPVDATNRPIPTYEMDATDGVQIYLTAMRDDLPDLVNHLLARNGVAGPDTALITHQGSRAMLDHWAERIRPGQYLETLETLGNMVLATYPVNLSHHFDSIATRYVVIAAVGPGFHLAAVLLHRT